ncbi:hypothetical protein KIN20_020962 [Parelaphostrongylus tenuis]|uniref:Uncharacterized protein n=1 Tax=Parelaphostrongylus tenuis TaxID=148309 RepID=A0AAD5QR86_PARTN|nr:hypothetical protein KIN20_020962 [Parelaphostrongylus tenuis]
MIDDQQRKIGKWTMIMLRAALSPEPSQWLFANQLVPLLISALGAVPQMKWIDDGLVNKCSSSQVKMHSCN